MTRKGRRQKLKSGWEYDWATPWRGLHAFNSGVGKYIKKGLNKRMRKEAKKEIEEDL